MVFFDLADGDVKEVGVVSGDDGLDCFEKGAEVAAGDEIFVEDVGAMGVVVGKNEYGFVEEAIAAVGTVGYFPWFGMGLIMLIKLGSSVHISQMAGKNDINGIKKIGNTGFVLMLGMFLLYMLFGVFFTEFYVGLFKLDNVNVVSYSTDYMRIISLFGFSYFLTNFFNGVYEGLGKTLNTFLITASGLLLNMILDPLFILNDISVFGMENIGLGLGVKGAAIATVISQGFIFATYIVIYLFLR